MSDAIYRPLIVMVEAVAAEALRKLAEQPSATRVQPFSMRVRSAPARIANVVEYIARIAPEMEGLQLSHLNRSDEVEVSVPCKVCGERHRKLLSGEWMMAHTIAQWADAIFELPSSPCPKPIELRAIGSLVVHGSISVDMEAGGNLRICKTHTPSEALTIERADIDDLIAGLRHHGLIARRKTPGGDPATTPRG